MPNHTVTTYICLNCKESIRICNKCVDNNGQKTDHIIDNEPCRHNADNFISKCDKCLNKF